MLFKHRTGVREVVHMYLAASPALGSVGRPAGVDADVDDVVGGCPSSTTHFSSLAPAVSIGTLLFMIDHDHHGKSHCIVNFPSR